MIRLHHSPRTRSVRILWLLEELGLPYELKTMTFTPDALKSPDYLKLNPFGKVPSIEADGVTMYESGAIVEWVLERYGEGRLAPAPGTPERAAFLQWLHFSEATYMPPLVDIAQHMMMKPEEERIPAVVAAGFEKLNFLLGAVENIFGENPYLLGQDFSAADVMLGYSLLLSKWLGALSNDRYPKTAAYLARLEERPALQKALTL